MQIAIGIMAAGASRRLGSPKQLLPWKKGNLLNHTIKQCLKIDIADLYVVIGAHRESIEDALIPGNYTLLFNDDWEEGMSASIRTFIHTIDADVYDGVLILVGDQPFISGKILLDFFDLIVPGKKQLIVSKYDKGKGPPSYFSYHYFHEMLALEGDSGAKTIIKNNKEKLLLVKFPKGNIDIDLAEDVEKWLQKD